MFRNKPHSLEESPNHPLLINAVWKHLPILEGAFLKKKVKDAFSLTQFNLAKWRKKENNLDPKVLQQWALADIGTTLQKARLSQSLSLDEITLKTQIPQRLLEAIEAGTLANLPEPVYVRSMIRQFAEVVGLDGTTLSHQLPIDPAPITRSPRREKSVIFFQIQPIHLYLFYILVVMLSVQGIANVLRQSAPETSLLDEKVPPLPALTQAIAPQLPNPIPVAHTQPIPTDKVTVEVKISEDSWVKVMVDGKSDFEGILPKGTHRTWTGQKAVKVRAGNAGGVQVTVNQQKLQLLGKSGQIQEITYKVPTQS
jgi:cytoskeletal protein RodZ